MTSLLARLSGSKSRLVLGALALALAGTTACKGDKSTGPTLVGGFNGIYKLQTINDEPVPAIVCSASGTTPRQEKADSATIEFKSTNTYNTKYWYRSIIDGVEQPERMETGDATYSRTGSTIQFIGGATGLIGTDGALEFTLPFTGCNTTNDLLLHFVEGTL